MCKEDIKLALMEVCTIYFQKARCHDWEAHHPGLKEVYEHGGEVLLPSRVHNALPHQHGCHMGEPCMRLLGQLAWWGKNAALGVIPACIAARQVSISCKF